MPDASVAVLAAGAPFLAGARVCLRPLERADVNARYAAWLNDAEVTRYLEVGTFPTSLVELEAFYAAAAVRRDQVLLAIVDRETDRHVGNIKLGPIDWVHRRATLGILVGDKAAWGRGTGTSATRLMVEYAFDRLDLRRVDLGVYADHAAAIRLYERVGFRVEGRFREDVYLEGAYRDRLWMGLLRSEYQRTGPGA